MRDITPPSLRFHRLSGSPREIGLAHGRLLRDAIEIRIAFYNSHSGATEHDLDHNSWYATEREDEVTFHTSAFPHLIEEARAIAEASGFSRERIYDLTFGGWGRVQRAPRTEADETCSLVALKLKDGHVGLLSTLDDPPEIWPALAHYTSTNPDRLGFVTTARPGTPGTGRGMNEAGLWIGTASSGVGIAPGGSVARTRCYNLSFLLRAILEKCRTVREVADFCRTHPFACNLLVGDAAGGVLGIHQTPAETLELPLDEYLAMTNCIGDNRHIHHLTQKGLVCHESAPTARPRLGHLQNYLSEHAHHIDFEELLSGVAKRDIVNSWSINHAMTAYITAAIPSRDPGGLWVCRPSHSDRYTRFDITGP